MLKLTLSDTGKVRLTDPIEIVQGVLAAMIIGAVSYCGIRGLAISPELMFLATAAIGFYFGKSVQSGVTARQGNA